MSGGSRNSPAVVTALMRSVRAAAVGRLARGARALLEQAEDVGGVRRVRGAGGRRAQRAPRALGQRDAQLALERGDGGRHGGLRDDELLGRRGHRSAPDDGEERHELGEGHGHATAAKHIAKAMT